MQVLLRGTCREELKKIKRAMQLAVFAAYHLSLETSFLADEGATLPKIPSISVTGAPDISASPTDHGTPDSLRNAEETYPQNSTISQIFEVISASSTLLPFAGVSQGITPECRASKFPVDPLNSQDLSNLCHPNVTCNANLISPCSVSDDLRATCAGTQHGDSYKSLQSSIAVDVCRDGALTLKNNQPCHSENHSSNPSLDDFPVGDTDDKDKLSAGSLSGSDNNQSILVSLSSTCIPKSLACQRSHLLRIKFYGSFDKPLGRYLREDLFDQVLLVLLYVTYCITGKSPMLFAKQHFSVTFLFFAGILLPIL
jgi:1-phosphatidylinositol-3-phosphate 5-kinase